MRLGRSEEIEGSSGEMCVSPARAVAQGRSKGAQGRCVSRLLEQSLGDLLHAAKGEKHLEGALLVAGGHQVLGPPVDEVIRRSSGGHQEVIRRSSGYSTGTQRPSAPPAQHDAALRRRE